ncbi:MAG: membrane protein [Sulfuricurvum sp. PC08-66]|nr:MAG: membrane protein [Sulfuricurvum sp. PC08-66]
MPHIDLFGVADTIGIIFFAISGALVAIKNRLDLLGFFISGYLTALGGGIIRDLLLDRTPISFVLPYPALIVFLTLLAVLALKLQHRLDIDKKGFFVASDTIGLVAFSIAGSLLAIEAQFNLFGVIVLGFLTAVGGGLLRDVLINEIPAVLISNFYGSIAVAVALILFALDTFYHIDGVGLAATALFALALRLLAYYRNWRLPIIS